MEYEENLQRERILKLMHKEGLTQGEFCEKIRMKQPNVSKILNARSGITKPFLTRILNAFPNVNKDWLWFGEGSMYDGQEEIEVPTDTKPRMPRTLSEGHLTDYFEGHKRHLCQEKPIITQFPNYDFSLFLKTDRMSPNYRRGDELFFKKTDIFEPGGCYLIDTKEGPKFKRIYEEEGKYRCRAFNTDEYPDFFVSKDIVFGFYKCVGVLRII